MKLKCGVLVERGTVLVNIRCLFIKTNKYNEEEHNYNRKQNINVVKQLISYDVKNKLNFSFFCSPYSIISLLVLLVGEEMHTE